MEFLPENIEAYAAEHTAQEPKLLQDLSRNTQAKILMPRMLSGHLQGRFLSLISKLINPKTILEIGTYTGYSALCLAEGLSPEGKLITLDINEELQPFTQSYFDKSKYKDQIDFKIGNALEIIPNLNIHPDLVFIDADKNNYSNYLDLIADKISSGGLVIADNVLWSGKVLDKPDQKDLDTQGLQAFNKKVHEDPRFENLLLPIRDGLMLLRKIG